MQIADPANEAWRRFSRAATAHEFCQGWLEVQCRMLPHARAGIVALRSDQGEFAPAARWAPDEQALEPLGAALEQALRSEQGVIEPLGEEAVVLALPVRIRDELFGAVAIATDKMPPDALRQSFVNLSWGTGWLEVLFRRRQADADGAEVKATRLALDLTTDALEQTSARAGAMALVNAVVDRLGARSAALALRSGRKLRIQAFSRTAWFQARSHLAVAVLEAMEESIDQIAPVSFPELPGTQGQISVAHKGLNEAASAGTVLSVPVLAAGKPVGALTLEFDPDAPPAPDTVLLIEAVGAVAGSALADKLRQDRILSGRAPRAVARFWRALRDPRRVAAKIALVLGLAALAALATARAPLRVTADAVVEGIVQRAIVAPIDGFVEAAPLRAGDLVAQGDLLARLDDRDLRLEILRLESEKARAEKEYRDALARQDRLESALLRFGIEETDAELRLVAAQLQRLSIRAPIDGVIVSGDLTRDLGTPIEKGQPLFQIAPLGSYRVILKVDERDILLVQPGQSGLLSLEAISGGRLPARVEKVTPVSTPEEGRNYFRVEAALEASDVPLRPGMEGVGKIETGEASLVWVWVRPLVNWARIKAWAWLP